MYSPRPFEIKDFEIIESFVKENSLAVLISNGDRFPYASHIPLYMEKHGDGYYLIGHAARANEQIRNFGDLTPVTVVFKGPDGYISAYAKDPKKLSILPTWDYQVVEIRGQLNFVTEDKLREFLVKLLDIHESKEPKSMNLDRYPVDVLKKKMKAIIGFEIKIDEAIGCFRLNQNRTEEERQNIIDQLEKDPSTKRLIEEIKKINQ